MSLNFGIDFDGTYTEDPDLWMEFFELAHRLGHKTYIVTMRNEVFEGDYVYECIEDKVDGIIFTSRHNKEEYIRENYFIDIDIWIDNDPVCIVKNHPTLYEMNESVREHELWINRSAETMIKE